MKPSKLRHKKEQALSQAERHYQKHLRDRTGWEDHLKKLQFPPKPKPRAPPAQATNASDIPWFLKERMRIIGIMDATQAELADFNNRVIADPDKMFLTLAELYKKVITAQLSPKVIARYNDAHGGTHVGVKFDLKYTQEVGNLIILSLIHI